MKSIKDKIREATKSRTTETKNCNHCDVQGFCDETQDYFAMNFCDNTAEEIIDCLNETEEEVPDYIINKDKLHLNIKG